MAYKYRYENFDDWYDVPASPEYLEKLHALTDALGRKSLPPAQFKDLMRVVWNEVREKKETPRKVDSHV